MLNNEIITKRLALIKYLFKLGVEQSFQSETIASFSILLFHDSIEMFLKLLAEHKDLKSDSFSFVDYWKNIPTLTLKESMSSLNARRVNIKHKGLLPSKSDIEISRVNATDFYEQNTLLHFGVDFNDISLFSLVQYNTTRKYLEDAQKDIEENRLKDCIEQVSIAFDDLLSTYESSKSSHFGSSPFYFGKDLTFLSSFHMGISKSSSDKSERKLAEFVDKVKDSLDGIQKAVKILSFGIDYKRFTKFKLLTPVVTRTMGGRYVAEVWDKKKWNKENCQYCIDFVLDCALKLQEFDFDIGELIETKSATIIIEN